MNNKGTVREKHLDLNKASYESLQEMKDWLKVFKETRKTTFQRGVALIEKLQNESEEQWKAYFNPISNFPVKHVTGFTKKGWFDNKTGFLNPYWGDASIGFETGINRITTVDIDGDILKNSLSMSNFEVNFGWRIKFEDMGWIERYWNNLAQLFPEIRFWMHECFSVHERCGEIAMKFNQELRFIDNEIEEFRKRIYDIETEAFFGGAHISFQKEFFTGLKKFWVGSRKFEFVRSVQVLGYSSTGKTLSIRIVYSPKKLVEKKKYQIEDFKILKTKTISGIRKKSLLRNFALPPR